MHKLVTSTRRPAAMQTKTIKDIDQAALLFRVLLEDRPGDISMAVAAAKQMPEKFLEQIQAGAKKLPDEIFNEFKKYME